MTIEQIIDNFILNVKDARWQEWVSTATQIASVWYARKNNILVFPTGIIGVLLASWVYFVVADPPLYADAILNIYYFLMSVYGWYNWMQKNSNTYVYPISWCTKQQLTAGIGFFFSSGQLFIFYY